MEQTTKNAKLTCYLRTLYIWEGERASSEYEREHFIWEIERDWTIEREREREREGEENVREEAGSLRKGGKKKTKKKKKKERVGSGRQRNKEIN
jgi:hypothetical protein